MVYLHIPFCKKACNYCNFHFSTHTSYYEDMLNAMLQEIEYRKEYLATTPLKSIYFGGGTPSIVPTKYITAFLEKLEKLYGWENDIEISLEANPDDLTIPKLQELKNSGINRLSIGIQSFVERDLIFMNRSHTAPQAIECIKNAQNIGIDNISIDLIYGTPTLSSTDWQKNLQQANDLQIAHLSCYALTVEPNTALYHQINTKKISPVDDDKMVQQFHILHTFLDAHAYEAYEVSNFCKNKKYALHNTNYWLGSSYTGIGPSAHSFNQHSRQYNISNNIMYMKAIQNTTSFFEIETLTAYNQYNEYILTSLRTQWGTDVDKITDQFGKSTATYFLKQIMPYIKQGLVHQNNTIYTLTLQGKLYADTIQADLFQV